MTMLPADLDRALYAELVHLKPSEPDALRMQWGPTEQARLLELEREKWRAIALFDDDETDTTPTKAAS